jgi:hypothetical protein
MIARDEADIAAIDCVTFEQLRTLEPALVAAVRVIGLSDASPGLPLVTAAGTEDRTLAALRAALADIVADTTVAPALDALLIDGFDVLSLDAYQNVIELERRRRRPWLSRAGVKPRLLLDRVTIHGFQPLLSSQEQYMDDFWRRSDVGIRDIREERTKRSTVEIQQAVRFNLFHILEASARARHGRTGEGPHRAGI